MREDGKPSVFFGMVRRFAWIGITAALVLCLVGLAYFAGFATAKHKLPTYETLNRIDRKIEHTLHLSVLAPRLESQTFSSAFLTLVSDVGYVDTGRSPFSDTSADRFGPTDFHRTQNGGGLTSFGRDVLLLTFNGVIYAAASSKDIRATGLVAPDNHRADYINDAKKPENAAYDMRPGVLRYNDLLFVDSPVIRALIASYTEYHSDRRCYTNTLARLDIDVGVSSVDELRAGPEDWNVFFRTEPCLPLKPKYVALEGDMAGGRVAFAAPATLYLTSGDYHHDGMRSDTPPIAQDESAQYGKVLAVDMRSGEAQVVSMGHRNPSGIVVLPDGDVYVVEHGPRGGDELNRIRPGANFGWPRESYGTTYRGIGIPGAARLGRHEAFDPPAFAWLPSVATSSVAEVRGFSDIWDGDLLVGTLKDRSLHRIRIAEGHGVYDERIEIGSRIRDVLQHSDGRIVLWTDNEELIFLTAREKTNLDLPFTNYVRSNGLGSQMASRLHAALEKCAECHSFDVDDHAGAPSLARIYGDDIANSSYAGYSEALKRRGGSWTPEALSSFLENPQGFAPGTQMPSPEIESDVRQSLIGFLRRLDENY